MNICIFDDQEFFKDALYNIVEDYLEVNHPKLNYSVCCFTRIPEMIEYINANKVDVVFLDISTKEDENEGIRAARKIRLKNQKAHIIFVSSSKDKIAMSFEGLVRPTDFLTKPVEQKKVHDLLKNIVLHSSKSKDYISFKFGRTEYLLRMEEICFLQKFAHKMVVTTEKKSFEVTNTISSLVDVLPEYFVRIDKGVIVNLNFIDTIDYVGRTVVLKNGVSFEMSRNARTDVKQAITRIVGSE